MTSQRRAVVLGSGAAGMAAALAAAVEGADVTVLERADHLGGTTAWSGGGIWIPGNESAREGGIDDTTEDALRYLRSVALGDADESMLAAYVYEGARVVAATERHAGLHWHQLLGYPDYHAEFDGGRLDGRSLEIDPVHVPPDLLARIRRDPNDRPPTTLNEENLGGADEAEIDRRRHDNLVTRGRGLVGALAAALIDRGGTVLTGVRSGSLLRTGDAITGVEAGGREFEGAVIIATGGFERDPALVRAFLRGPMVAPGGAPTNEGDGLRLGMAAGAALANMSEAWWAPALAVPGAEIEGAPYFRILFREGALPGAFMVDRRGRRFTNEAANYNDLGRALHDYDPSAHEYTRVPSWLIFDAACRRERPVGSLQPSEPDPPWLASATTLADLARRIDVPAEALETSVARFNEIARTGVDADFGRGQYAFDRQRLDRANPETNLRPLTEGPYYAMQVLPGCLGTKGGLKTDAHGRVLRATGDGAIEGLFAAGNASANPFGHAYPGSGGTIGPAVVFGWCAGETAAGA